MKSRIIILLCLLLFIHVRCSNLEARDEKTYPNGTLVGTYTYVDTQGNQVHVNYFADSESYSVNLKGCKMPENEVQNHRKSSSVSADPTTVLVDTMVPLKLDLPEIGTMYTMENPHNITNDIAKKKSWPESEDMDDQPIDYDTVESVLHSSKPKTSEKDKGYKKFIRKIRQTLDTYVGKIPST